MTRASAAAVAALALAGAACGGKKAAPAAGVNLRAPSSAAFFSGYTFGSPTTVRSYVAIANAGRNDLSILDGKTDLAVPAPILLRTLEIPVPARPAILAATSLGDDTPPDPYAGTPGTKRPDLLVAVSAGSSKLQLVQTWNAVNAIDPDAPVGGTVDLAPISGDDVLAIVAMPTPTPGTARLAVALASGKLAVVDYTRGPGDPAFAPIVAGTPVIHPLVFQPVALAAMPGDPSHVYAASLEEISPGVFGVGEIDTGTGAVRALDARAPTRLVAAARLRERRASAVEPGPEAFGCDSVGTCPGGAQPIVTRVYAVLDEASCGRTRRIDCGVVVIDPVLGRVPPDWDGAMPYRAPIRLIARPEAIAAAMPPAFPPSQDAADAVYAGSFMRIYAGEPVPALTGNQVRVEATTGVGAVANTDGNTVFLDLGRSKVATVQSPLTVTKALLVQPQYVNDLRLWIQNPASGAFAGAENPPTGNTAETDAARYITLTPGWTPDDAWSVTYQGKLPGLDTRNAEVGSTGSALWLAIQRSAPGATPVPFTEVARLWDPALGVHADDIVVVTARSVVGGACLGTNPPGTSDPNAVKEFELRIADLLPPTAAYPGGAVQLRPPADTDPQEWKDCSAALNAAVAQGSIATLPEATVRAAGLLLEGGVVGYAGRPSLGQPYTLSYPTNSTPAQPDEDTLALACPVADWQGPPAAAPLCDTTCRTACETLVLGRKVRRYDHLAESCGGDPTCEALWTRGGSLLTFPLARGPALVFQIGVQPNPTAVPQPTVAPARDLVVRFSMTTLLSQLTRPTGAAPVQANGIVAFDRSPWDPTSGYRFIVPYSTDSAMDATPSTSPISVFVIR